MSHKKGQAKPPKFILMVIWLIIGAATLIILGVWIALVSSKSPAPTSPPVAAQSAVSTKTITVDTVWQEVYLPPWTRFEFVPEERGVLLRLANGEIFTVFPNARVEPDLPDPIPGFSVGLRSFDLKPTKVTLYTWPAK